MSRLDREKRQGAKVGLAVFAGICLLGGVAVLFGSSQTRDLEHAVQAAMVRSAEDAAEATGLVCVEATAPEVAQPYRIPGTQIDCLYVEEKREKREKRRRTGSSSSSRSRTTTTTNDHAAPTFGLGPLTVNTNGATYRGTRQLHQTSNSSGSTRTTVTWSGIEAGTPVTVVGTVNGGAIAGGEPFVITPLPSKQALVDDLESSAKLMSVLGFLALIVGFLAGGGAAVAFLKG
jgi:hypothetical protein